MKSKQSTPIASRPRMPKNYGVPNTKTGLLKWLDVSLRLTDAKHYWIATVTPDGRPHSTPVDGLWLEEALYFGGSPETRWNRNLAQNPAANVHLESAAEVVILRGEAHPLKKPGQTLTATLMKASTEKYGWAPAAEQYAGGGIYVFRPRVVLAWKEFPKDVTRWEFLQTNSRKAKRT